MNELLFSLVSDGASDKALIPLLKWLLQEHLPNCAIQGEWADLRRLPRPPRELEDRITTGLSFYECDLLFIHRDAEGETVGKRIDEINKAIERARVSGTVPPVICVVPVRMMEAWLLFDLPSIRRAAGNPSGSAPLDLPRISTLESLPDPKSILLELLRKGSGLTGRRLKKFHTNEALHRVSQRISDFGPLRALPAFQCLEEQVVKLIASERWC